MILRRFANERGNLHVFNKEIADKGVLEIAPKDTFLEGHLYTAINKDGTKDVALERYYSQIEGVADRTIEKIVTAAREGRKPGLTPEEKEAWDHYVYHQWKRVPDFHEKITSWQSFDEAMDDAIGEFEQRIRPLTPAERDSLQEPATRQRMRKNAGVLALRKPGEGAVAALAGRGLGVAVIRNPKKSFVIGSMPLVKLTHPGQTNLSDPTVEVWFPISYDVAVSPWGDSGAETLVGISDGHVRALNESSAKQSTAFAGRSAKLIESLSRRYRP